MKITISVLRFSRDRMHKTMGTIPKNFRLSREAVEILNKVATELGVTQTDVLEASIARHAAEHGIAVDGARELLLRQIAKGASSRKKKRAGRRRFRFPHMVPYGLGL